MVLALAPTAASAGGFQPLSEADARKAQSDYLNSLGSSSADNAHAPGLVVDGFQIPSDVAAMKSFQDGYVRVLVTVPGDTIAAYAIKHSSSLTTMTAPMAAPAVTKIKADQDASLQAVQARGVILRGVRRFSVLFNGYSAQIAVGDLGKLAEAVGRANVHFSRLTQLEDTNANTLIGADAVQTDPGVDGTGAYVGVCDTGVDYTHPDFGGDGTNHGFPTAKVVAGYDFAGDNAGAIDNPALIAPDHDPMDTNEHGTHVSGIVAADGAVTGVAPKAKIVIAKISPAGIGSAWSDEIIAAWEYMADPNNVDLGDEGSHPPVQSVNMSFGSVSGFDDPTDPERLAIESAISSGIVATLSAGNSGSHYASPFNYNFYPDYSTLGSPAVTSTAISVASSENSVIAGWGVTETTAAADYVYFTGSASPDPVVSLGDNAGAGYQYVYCGIGNASDFVGKVLTGKIALIDRGTISFYVKINNAAAAGAVGAIIANNTTGTISMNTDGSTLTSVSITRADGLTLKAKAAAPIGDGTGLLKFLGHQASTPNLAVDTISSFSSWGATPNLTFKPEVTAPGGNIWSTVPVAQGSYANLSGTSMAAPHVAGAAALIKLVHPTWTVEQVKTALMNTGALLIDPASPAHLPYSPRLQGAGRINVYNALHTDVVVTSQLDGKAAVALGSVESWTDDAITFPLVLHNSGATPVTYDVTGTIQWVNAGGTAKSYAIPGATFAASAPSVTIAAGGTRTVTITIDARAVSLTYDRLPYVEGFVTFTPASGVALHVPYMGYLGNWNDFDSDTWAPTFNPLVDLPHWWNSYSANIYSGDVGDTGATWPEDPTNGWNQMGKTFTGAFDENTIAINPLRAATGPQGGIENNIWVLRNIENLKVEIRDASGGLVKLIDDVNNLWKGNYASYGNKYTWYWSGNASWQWYGRNAVNALVADGQYYLNTVATAEKVINKLSYDAPQTVSFPVYVDTINPVASVTSVEAGTPGNWKVNFTGLDAASGLWGYAVYYGVVGTDPNTWAHTMVAPAATTSCQIPAGKGFLVVAYDNAGNVTIADQVFSDVVITTTLLPSGSVDQAYTTTLVANGGTGLYYYTLSAGTLPDGLTLSSSGTVSGTPLVAGDYPITVQATDGNSVDTQALTLAIFGSGLAITTPSPLPTGMLGVPYYQVLSAVGGDGINYSWSLNSGELPPGLGFTLLTPSITASTASLHGTPTLAGTYTFNLRVVSNGQAVFKDFSITIEPVGAVSGLIYHYYMSLLDHAPDMVGFTYWQSEIARIQSLGIDVKEGFIALARVFVATPEYLAKGTSDAAYITDLYETFFNRTPSGPEVTYWTDLMTAGMSRDIALNWFVYSPECTAYMTSVLGSSITRPENNLVNDFYRGFFNRLPDTTGFNVQLAVMRAAQASDAAAVRSTTLAIALNFVGGPEYALRARTNTQFIEDCYNGILRRGALPAEIQGWVNLLTAGATRTEVLTGFVNSPEFQARVDQVIAAGPFVP
jgi:lactocepin